MPYNFDSRLTLQKTLPEYPHEDIPAVLLLRLMLWSAVLAGILAALTMPPTLQWLKELLTTSFSFPVFSKFFLLPFDFLEALGVFNAAALFFKNIDRRHEKYRLHIKVPARNHSPPSGGGYWGRTTGGLRRG